MGVGLLYQQGYFRQYLNPDGWQQERYPHQRFLHPAVQPGQDANGNEHRCQRQSAHRRRLHPGLAHGRGPHQLYCWIPTSRDNVLPQDRDITDSLYGGDIDTRIRQEIVLGIGGMRALEGHGSQAHRLPHERRPFGVSRAGTDPPVHARRQTDLR